MTAREVGSICRGKPAYQNRLRHQPTRQPRNRTQSPRKAAYNYLDGVPPRWGALGQPVRGVISGAALHLAQQPLIPGQIEEAGAPPVGEQHVLSAVRVGPPAGP